MFLEHHIRVISEGSRDTEDWSNCFAFTRINYILKYCEIITI